MRLLGVYTANWADTLLRGSRVIARTDRGLEVGEVLCEATEQALAHLNNPTKGQLLRTATAEDEREILRLCAQERHEFELCRRHVAESGLDMKLVDVERIFGGERIVVYYLSENRVDFRNLVKVLAAEFQTRIEMRQIGVRDEAKLLADYGDCGKPVCCNTHLSEMPPVSMKMAKLQKATLDPAKISGRCGRLKCCLRYEYDTYEELQQQLPPVGADVVTNQGRARVLGQEILAGQVLVEMEDRRRILIDAQDVLTVLSKRGDRRPSEARREPDEGSESQPLTARPKEGRSTEGRRETEARKDENGGGEQRGEGRRAGRGPDGRKNGARSSEAAGERPAAQPPSSPSSQQTPSSSQPPASPSSQELPPGAPGAEGSSEPPPPSPHGPA